MRISVDKTNRVFFDRVAKGLFVGVALFALIGGFLAFPAYSPIVLTTLGLALAFKAIGTPPATKTRSFLYLMGALAAMAITATLLSLVPSVGLVIGLTGFIVAASSVATRYLEGKHSLSTDLPFLSRGSYVLAGVAFLGLAIGFSLMAAHVLPTFILLPVLLGCTLGAAALTSVVTLCTPVKDAGYAPVAGHDAFSMVPGHRSSPADAPKPSVAAGVFQSMTGGPEASAPGHHLTASGSHLPN